MPLPAFLKECARRPFAPGTHDCVLMACDWVKARTGTDPAAAWRGRYADRRGALRIIAQAGGMQPLVAGLMAGAGLEPTTDPLPGDVAVVVICGDTVGAIRTMSGWACCGPNGVVVAEADVLAAWSV